MTYLPTLPYLVHLKPIETKLRALKNTLIITIPTQNNDSKLKLPSLD